MKVEVADELLSPQLNQIGEVLLVVSVVEELHLRQILIEEGLEVVYAADELLYYLPNVLQGGVPEVAKAVVKVQMQVGLEIQMNYWQVCIYL